jgi:Rrf2 family protein
MLTPNKKIFYAIEAVLYIAYNAKTGPIAGNHVAEAQNLPTRYLEPIMQKLVRSGILRGVRGPAGGYVLGRERRRITLADICDCIGATTSLPSPTTTLGKKILRPLSGQLMEQWRILLADMNIATLCERAEKANIASTENISNDFII